MNLTAGAALTDDAHKKVTEAIVELLDVSEHAHGAWQRGDCRVHAVHDGRRDSLTTGPCGNSDWSAHYWV